MKGVVTSSMSARETARRPAATGETRLTRELWDAMLTVTHGTDEVAPNAATG